MSKADEILNESLRQQGWLNPEQTWECNESFQKAALSAMQELCSLAFEAGKERGYEQYYCEMEEKYCDTPDKQQFIDSLFKEVKNDTKEQGL